MEFKSVIWIDRNADNQQSICYIHSYYSSYQVQGNKSWKYQNSIFFSALLQIAYIVTQNHFVLHAHGSQSDYHGADSTKYITVNSTLGCSMALCSTDSTKALSSKLCIIQCWGHLLQQKYGIQ